MYSFFIILFLFTAKVKNNGKYAKINLVDLKRQCMFALIKQDTMKNIFLQAQIMLKERTTNMNMLKYWAFSYCLFDTYHVGSREFKTTLNARINARGVFECRYKTKK